MLRNLFVLTCLAVLMGGFAFGSCTAPANVIEAENCNPGTTGWEVGGSGDPTIQGFATDISVNAGQVINFKISTPATAYHIDIYRLGYYGGNGGRYITTIQPSVQLPQTQPACLTDAATALYDCGNWGVSASWPVPSNAVSGVYIAAPVRNDTGGASQMVFIVRNDTRHSDILLQTSDETWHAYNPYGGHSLYGNTEFILTDRAYKVSYNRPFNTANLETYTWIFSAEYPMIRWLEANSYDVSYFTSVDAARSGNLITNHKIYLSVGHDEYWSGLKRASVEAARAAGVNLAFFSGNETFWKTRWENSIDGTNTPYRTLVCYKETLGPNSNPAATAAVDPLDPPIWTGTWRDPTKSPPADGGKPENALHGTIFRVNGPGTDNTNLSIKVPADDGKMRFWRNTSVGAQSAGQTWILPPGTLGYEWDDDEDNGFRPAGLIDLSTATYNLTTDYLQDYGGFYGAGTATHHLTLYRYYQNLGQATQSPLGLVFGAGTVQWSWGLDANHDNSVAAADPNMQQATVNLFADMGVQPATLQPGLVAASMSIDTIAPTSTITSLPNGTTVRVGTAVNITGVATDTGGGVIGGVEISLDGGTTWHPAPGRSSWSYSWTPSTSGFYIIRTRATDDSGNLEIPSAGISVTASTTAQSLTALTLNPSSVMSGSSIQGTVSLGQPAAAGGVVVTLSSSNPTIASVPATVTVPAGQFTANFTVSGGAVPLPTSATISGTFVSTSSASLTVTPALPPAPGSIAIDVFLPKDQGTAGTSIVSGTFSTAVPNELLLAFVATDALSSGVVVSSMTNSPGLTWSLVKRTNTQMGTAEIWKAFATNQVSNSSVTANLSQNVAASMLVISFAGVDPSGGIGATGGGSSASGTPSASLTTTRNNSLVVGVGNDWDSAIVRTLGSNQTLLHQLLTNAGDTYWMQMQTSPIPTSGTAALINDTAPSGDSYNLSIVEVIPAPAGTFSISGTISPTASGSGTTLTLSGSAAATTTADASGNYSFPGLGNGSYTITPAKSNLVFSPSSQTITLNGAGKSGVNFTALTLTSIAVSPTNPSVASGSSVPFTATGNYSDGSTQNLTAQVTWTSSNSGVATINASGVATGIAGGSTTISATQGTTTGSTTLTVQPTALVINTTSLPSGQQGQTYAALLSANGGTSPYSWSLANNTVLPAGLTLSGAQISGTPTVAGTGTFTVQVSDGGSPPQTVTKQLSMTILAAPAFDTIWPTSSAPVNADAGPDNAVELGVLFKSDLGGTVSGIRFYKSANNTGTHVGNLWSSTGTLLASANFANETASGWQQANFSTPVTISTNTVYVASYHTTVGHYSDDQNYFANAGVDTPPLHALQNGVSGSDGVFAYGATSVFPSTGFNSSNYWVDVVFVPSATLTSIAVTPANPTIQAGSTQPFTATGTYSDNSTQNITSQVTWASSNTQVATISASGVASGLAGGNSTVTATLGSVTNNTRLTVQPATLVITTTSLPGGTQGLAYTANLSSSGGTPMVSWTLINSTVLPAGLTMSTAGQISGTPTASGTTTFTVQATDSGTPAQTATQTLSITITASGCPCSIGGNISGSGGNTATVTLSGTASATVTADTSGNYIFNGLANGTYTVTPSKSGFIFNPTSQGITIAGASKTGVNFGSTAQLAIAQAVSTDRSSPATSIASPTFSTTKPNELLLVFVATDATASNITASVAGASLSWTLVKRTNAQLGTAEIWRAFSPTTLSSVSVTATLSQSVAASITVVTFTGADPSGPIGNTGTGNANPGAPTAQLTTTRNNSWVIGVGDDYDNAIARTLGPSQTMVHQYLATVGDTYWVQRQTATTPASGTVVTINDTAPTGDRYNLSICEILPAP